MDVAVYLTLVTVMLLGSTVEARFRRPDRRLSAVQRKPDLVMDRLAIEETART